MACKSKTAGRRARPSEIRNLGVVVACIWSTLDLLVFNGMLGSLCNWKISVRRVKQNQIWDSGVVVKYIYEVSLTFKFSVQSHLGIIRCTCLNGCNSKIARLGAKRSEIWDSGSCNMCMGHHWLFSVQGHFGVIRCTCLRIACTSKWLDVEQNEVNFGTCG